MEHMKNRNYIGYFTSIVALLALASCTEVIDIELNDADRQIVIEGSVYEGVDSVIVSVTKTTNYFDTTGPTPVENATVELTMPDNSTIPLSYIGNGQYIANSLDISTESTYQLTVNVDGKTFTSSTYMESSVTIDSLQYEFQEGLFGGDDGYSVFINYQDPLGKNFYRFVYGRNGEILNEPQDIQIVDDNLNDGNYIRIPIFTRTFSPGDTVYIELQSIDSKLYEFYQTYAAVASEDAGSPFSAAPANPESNILGGALGVFGAYTRSSSTIIMPE
jgi:hypothetical protein